MSAKIRSALCFGLFVALFLAAASAEAQVPELLAIPKMLPEPDRSDFAGRRTTLLARLGTLQGEGTSFNTACASVDKGSAAAAACRSRQSQLEEFRLQYVAEADAFNERLRTKIAHYERFPPPPSPFQPSGHGMIGGVAWETTAYAFNVAPNMSPENELEVRREADKRLRAAMDRAGIDQANRIDPKQYNFIIGFAVSTNALTDLMRRAIFDNLNKGRATPALQQQYNLLRGRSFEPLDCHSNGAMICLGALSNQDVAARHVRLFGPQITPGALAEWQQLLRSGKITSLEIYISAGDPIPAVSHAARYLVPGAFSHDTAVRLTSEVLKDVGVLKQRLEEEGPSIKVIPVPCDAANRPGLFFQCHEMTHYQKVTPR